MVRKKASSAVKVKKRVSEAGPVHRVAKKKKPRLATARVKKNEFRAGAYYAVGAAALAFTFLLLVYQSVTQKAHGPVETAKVRDPRVAQVLSQESGTPLELEMRRVNSLPVSERMDYWSLAVEKNPGLAVGLRELMRNEVIHDSAPIVPEKLDCTTYVETVVALSRSALPKDVFHRILEIRYRDGQPSFPSRNHFVEADWIPNNQKSQVLSDITLSVAAASKVQSRIEQHTLHRGEWIRAQMLREGLGRGVASSSNEVTDVRIPYLPLEGIENVMGHIPNGTIVNFVREKSPRHPVLVSHQGLLIRASDGQVMLRHASTGGRVRTEALVNYLAGMRAHNQKSRRWGWLGLNLNQVSSSSPLKILRNDSI